MRSVGLSDPLRLDSVAVSDGGTVGITGAPRPYYRLAPERVSRVRGCLLAGAVGDALGAPVEFDNLDAIREKYGPLGICQPEEVYGRVGSITDDTQMTLFTAEGLLRAHVHGCKSGVYDYKGAVNQAYLRWLYTQGEPRSTVLQEFDGHLLQHRELFQRRAAGHTCISGLMKRTSQYDVSPAQNDSKGCGGVMRAAPVGLYLAEPNIENQRIFELGCATAALTHGHPTGQHPAGALAVMVAEALRGKSLRIAAEAALKLLRPLPQAEETRTAMLLALELSAGNRPSDECIPKLGQGWIAEGALAIGLFCALRAESLREGLLMAVNITGDSDSTGSIAGNLLGAERGVHEIPEEWLNVLELRELITEVADDLCSVRKWHLGAPLSRAEEPKAAYWLHRYPAD